MTTKRLKTWEDVYKLPVRLNEHSEWVYDAKNGFVFQFEYGNISTPTMQGYIDVINGEKEPSGIIQFIHKGGEIRTNDDADVHVITIRGWGRLTGTGGGLGLNEYDAINIQDTFAEYIVDRLNGNKEVKDESK